MATMTDENTPPLWWDSVYRVIADRLTRSWVIKVQYFGDDHQINGKPETIPARYRIRRIAQRHARQWNAANMDTNHLHYFVRQQRHADVPEPIE